MPVETLPALIFNIILVIITLIVVYRSSYAYIFKSRIKEREQDRKKRSSNSITLEAEEYISIRSRIHKMKVKDRKSLKRKKKAANTALEPELPRRLQKAIDRANNGTS